MRRPRFQIQLRWVMVAVAVVAVFLALPAPISELLGICGGVPALLVLIPAGVAPRGRRVEAGYWSLTLHPLLILAWLEVWRCTSFRQPASSLDSSLSHSLILELPYLMAGWSLVYLPVFALIGWIIFALNWYERPRAESFARLLVLGLPFTWLATFGVLAWDPFELYWWVRD